MIIKRPAAAGRIFLLSAMSLALAAQEPVPAPQGAPGEPPKEKPRESWAAESQPVAVSRTPGQVVIFR